MPQFEVRLFFCQLLIHPHEFCHAACLGHGFDVESVGSHDGSIVALVGLAELGGHGGLVVEIGKAGFRELGPCIQNSLGRLLDLSLLCFRGCGPREIIINNVFRIAVIALEPPAGCPLPILAAGSLSEMSPINVFS